MSHTFASRALPWKLCAGALLLLLAAVLCSRMSHPWTYNDDYNGAFWSQAACNLSRNGFFSTAGVPAPLYFGPTPIPAEALYVHHPTLLADMMLVDRMILGESEWAARALPILFSLLTALLLWLFVSVCRGWREGAFTLAFFVAAPMELHYGQMVNFEAPELFFMLGALCCFHLWRRFGMRGNRMGLLLCCTLAMWMDWLGYLLVILLAGELLIKRHGRNAMMAAGLLSLACFCGLAFLLQIHLAAPGAWGELFHAFRERSGHADLSGGAFTAGQWANREYSYITTLFNPISWLLAGAGAVLAFFQRRRFSEWGAAPLHIGAVLFLIDAFYVCALRNQSYIHDFACFYFLAPVAVFSGYLVESLIRSIEARRPGWPALAVKLGGCALAGALVVCGVRLLNGIDTQFCILGDDSSEPPTLMPDVGHLLDRSFPPDTVILCNFDRYYSPLPYYARRTLTNDLHSYADWQNAVSDAMPLRAGGIIWKGAPDAAELLRRLPAGDLREVTVDGVGFVLWMPRGR